MAATKRRLARRIGFSLGLTLFLVLGLEGALRLAGWPTHQVRNVQWLMNDDPASFARAIGVFRPGTVGRVAWPAELAYEVRINALGLRGPEVAREGPPPGTKRVLALGDSGTFGFYVGEEETFPARLEQLLRAGGVPVEVINGGCGGWSIDSATLFLEERAIALAPDLVVLVYCSNDISDLRAPEPSWVTLRDRVGEKTRSWLEATAIHELAWRTKARFRSRRARPLASDDLEPAERERLWGVYERWLVRLSGFLAERKVALLVVYQPDASKLAAGLPSEDEARLRELCGRRAVPFVSALPRFQERSPDETFLLPQGDPHPSALGYRLEAEAAAAAILARRGELGL